ncbi:MAG: hypothetical protein N3A58_06245 [Spirochaetes bacterium]|nr:hypothetical protein [Spirochaetota bacterium]
MINLKFQNYKNNIIFFQRKLFYFLFFVIFIFIFFPYLKIFNIIKTDTQPNALFISLILNFLFLPYLFYLNNYFVYLIIPFLMSLFLFPFSSEYIYGIREIGGYISVLSISISVYIYFKKYNFLNLKKFFFFVIFIWLIFGVLQYFFYDQIKTILPRLSTSPERGSTSLAPEPSYYGLMLVFFIWVTVEFFDSLKIKVVLILIILFQLLFIAKSAIYVFTIILVILLYLLIIFVLFIYNKIKLKYDNIILFYFLVFFSVLIILISFSFLKNTRIYDIFFRILKNPLLFFLKDESALDRLEDIFLSFKGFFENFGLPHFFGDWLYYINGTLNDNKIDFLKLKFIYNGTRIKSLWGGVLFNLGLIGLSYIFLINILLIKNYKKIKNTILLILFFNLIFISQVPLAHPFIGFLYGYLIYKNEIKELED